MKLWPAVGLNAGGTECGAQAPRTFMGFGGLRLPGAKGGSESRFGVRTHLPAAHQHL